MILFFSDVARDPQLQKFVSELTEIAESCLGGKFANPIFDFLFLEFEADGGLSCVREINSLLPLLSPFKHQEVVPRAEKLSQLAWEKLHTGYWKDVDIAWRDLFSLSSLILALSTCLHFSLNYSHSNRFGEFRSLCNHEKA